MDEIIHIVFGDSARGTLKYVLDKNNIEGEVIGLRDDYSIGPVYEIDTKDGIEKRVEWIKSLLKKIKIYQYFKDIEEDFIDIYDRLATIPSDTKIVIWHGKNNLEQLGLRFLLSLLKGKELYEVNVSSIIIDDEAGNSYKPRSLAECDPHIVKYLFDKVKEIDNSRYDELLKEWQDLRTTKENLRILQDDKLVGVPDNYYDEVILSNCTSNFQKAAEVIGSTMGKSDQLIGDTYLDYRVRELIESGKLEYQGKLLMIRDYQIKLK